jgi:DNA repair protein RecN (Recombination protein N)
MLAELNIEDFAIIDRLLVRFAPGFTVLTGETGAGKSIIVDALQAVLGARVPADVVRAGARFAAVEAVFDLSEADAVEAVQTILEDQGIDLDQEIILRREIQASGRSSGRVNGRAVPLALLSSLGGRLVDIHGQSEHLSILRRDRQLEAIDRFGSLLPLRARAGDTIRAHGRLRRQLDELRQGQRSAAQRLDLLRFQVGEIEAARLTSGEEEALQSERNLLANAERLQALAESAYESLRGETGSTLDGLDAAVSAARDLSGIDPALTRLSERLQAARYDLDDVAQELRGYRDSVEYDPMRLQAVEERLDLIDRLRRKYGATVEEVLAFGEQARQEMEDVENLDERLMHLERSVADAEAEASVAAGELSAARARAAGELMRATGDALRGLGLKATEFAIELTQTESADGVPLPGRSGRYAAGPTGVDAATFLASFNPGEPLRPLERVASGGETSRFLLALKSVLAESDRTPTLVFDEVDVGVGARDGMVVGERLRTLSRTHQVLSITHLPQIAALADEHLTVSKSASRGRTGVAVRAVESADRIREIAEMMTGTGTETARRNAEELLEAARRES